MTLDGENLQLCVEGQASRRRRGRRGRPGAAAAARRRHSAAGESPGLLIRER